MAPKCSSHCDPRAGLKTRLAIHHNLNASVEALGNHRELRGRVSSSFLVTRDIVFIIGMALAGLADLLPL